MTAGLRACLGNIARDVVKAGAQHAVIARVVQQKRVVAVWRVNFGVAHVQFVVEQRFDNFAAALRRKAPIGAEADKLELANRARKGGAQVPAKSARRVKVIEGAGDEQIGVGIEVVAELVTLMAQVALDFKLHVLRAVGRLTGLHVAAEFGLHRVVAQIGDVANHSRHAQAASR